MRIQLAAMAVMACAWVNAQEIDQDLRLNILPTGEKTLEWQGHLGRSYFIQASPNLANWTWAPNIEAGIDAPMSYEVGGAGDKGFFRLQYTDQTATDLDSADFDGDGLSNGEEITFRDRPSRNALSTTSFQMQTDPLNPDTDGDGLDDGWEQQHGYDPINADEDGNGTPDGQDDDDGDGSSNGNEAGAKTDPYDSEDFPVQSIIIRNYGQGYATNYTAPDETNRSSAFDFWPWNYNDTGTGYVHMSMTNPCVTLEYLSSLLNADSFPEVPPLPSAASASIGSLSSGSYAFQIDCNVWKSDTGSAVASTDFVLHRARVWIKSPPAPRTRKFPFVKIVERSFSPNNTSFSSDSIVSVEPIFLTIPAGAKTSGYTDLSDTPVAQDGGSVSDSVRLKYVNIKPDANMAGVIGDEVESLHEGGIIKHFVTPKKTTDLNQEYVELKVDGFDVTDFDRILVWDGGEAGSSPNKRKVRRDTVGKTEVKLITKQDGLLVAQMDVWVVWASVVKTLKNYGVSNNANLIPEVSSSPIGSRSGANWIFEAYINPVSILRKSEDIPDLTGAPEIPEKPPESKIGKHALDGEDFIDPKSKWDLSRSWRARTIASTVTSSDCAMTPGTIIAGDYPTPSGGKIHATTPFPGADHFPSNSLEGNDYRSKKYNPYSDGTLGSLLDDDTPRHFIKASAGSIGDKIEVHYQFKTFCRLQIGKKWYRISDKEPWRFHAKYRKASEQIDGVDYNEDKDMTDNLWVDDGTISDKTNEEF